MPVDLLADKKQPRDLLAPQNASPESMGQAIRENAPPPAHTFGQKFGMGAGDIWQGISQSFAHAPPIDPYAGAEEEYRTRESGEVSGPAYDQKMQGREQKWQQERKATGDKGIEWARGTGQFAASLPFAAMAPASGPIAAGAMQGAMQMGLMPTTDASKSYGSQKAGQLKSGAIFGGLFGAGQKLLGGLISPKVSPDVKKLAEEGVTTTFGQSIGPRAARAEEKLASVPGLGDLIKDSQRNAIESFNKAAYNRVLEPVGAKFEGDVGHDAVRRIGDKLSAAYESLVPALKLVPDEKLSQDLTEAAAAKATMSESAAKQFDAILEKHLPRGPLEGAPLKKLESQLTFEIGRFGKSPDPSHQMIADALSDVRSAVLENLARSRPEAAEKLSAINGGWANLVRVERAAANAKDGIFTPEGLLTAVKAADSSVRKRATARGESLMQDLGQSGLSVLGKAYPDSGSAGRVLMSGGALGLASPSALAAGAVASVPYLPGVRKLSPLAVTARPSWAPAARKIVESGVPTLPNGALIFGMRPPHAFGNEPK